MLKKIKIFSFILIVIIIGFFIYTYQFSTEKNFTNLATTNNNLVNNKYPEITRNLSPYDMFYVTNVIDNNNNTYTLQGVLYTKYILSDNEYQQIIDKGTMVIDDDVYKVIYNEYDNYCRLTNGTYPDYTIEKNDYITSSGYYLIRQCEAMSVWKLTNDYREITLPNDTLCDIDYQDGETDVSKIYTTVEKRFKNYESCSPINSTNPGDLYDFHFENGTCIEVSYYPTGV